MPKLLVCAAFLPELEALRRALSGAPVDFQVLGVGLVDSALGACSALASVPSGAQPAPIVLVGTVGAYPESGLPIGALVTARSVSLAAAPAELPAPLTEVLPAIPLAGLAQVRVATTLGITVDGALARSLAASADVEHMEAYAVARAAARFGVPFRAVFAVANIVGPDGRAQWRTHHQAVSDALAEHLAPRLRALAGKG